DRRTSILACPPCRQDEYRAFPGEKADRQDACPTKSRRARRLADEVPGSVVYFGTWDRPGSPPLSARRNQPALGPLLAQCARPATRRPAPEEPARPALPGVPRDRGSPLLYRAGSHVARICPTLLTAACQSITLGNYLALLD